ncbi:hypothetical protein AMTR_s00001p00210810 [Amborella trichopoda]|uniref:GATA transcription factor n=2 Tax=Amborella trichopoda TaxID=13333 RepID=W1NM81_AMBTC|nr:hypothetical protein AMTR_s00001p00210810 [Amborella trichopoda]
MQGGFPLEMECQGVEDFVEDILDFPIEENGGSCNGEETENQTENEAADPASATDLSVPSEAAAELEWLSLFVEDSFSEFPYASGSMVPRNPSEKNRFSPKPISEKLSLAFERPQVPGRARSKRLRSDRVWWLKDSSSSPCLIFKNPFRNADLFYCLQKPPSKTQNRPVKKKPPPENQQRRCSHCLVQKTPQWRAGPLGSKTLCNACGVRYKSGRLLPEYRPAGSPTFLSEIHSNSHRKVLEMRKKKELQKRDSGTSVVETC